MRPDSQRPTDPTGASPPRARRRGIPLLAALVEALVAVRRTRAAGLAASLGVGAALVVAPAAWAFDVEWDGDKPGTYGQELLFTHTGVTLGDGSIAGAIPDFRGQSFQLTSGRCWTGVGGVSFDNDQCLFALERQTRRAHCTREQRVRRRVTVRKHGRRIKVWLWKTVTTKFDRDVAATMQLEIAHDVGPFYFYIDKQREYGGAERDQPPQNPGGLPTPPPWLAPTPVAAAPVDAGYPPAGARGIDCELADLTVFHEGQGVAP